MTETDRKGKSPYSKYEKSPYPYSAAFNEWHRETKAGGGGDSGKAREAAQRHAYMFLGWDATSPDQRRIHTGKGAV